MLILRENVILLFGEIGLEREAIIASHFINLYYRSNNLWFDNSEPKISYIFAIYKYFSREDVRYSENSDLFETRLLNATKEYEEFKDYVLDEMNIRAKYRFECKSLYKLTFYQGKYFGVDLDKVVFWAHNLEELFVKIRGYLLENTVLSDGGHLDYFDNLFEQNPLEDVDEDNILEDLIRELLGAMMHSNDTLWITKLDEI